QNQTDGLPDVGRPGWDDRVILHAAVDDTAERPLLRLFGADDAEVDFRRIQRLPLAALLAQQAQLDRLWLGGGRGGSLDAEADLADAERQQRRQLGPARLAAGELGLDG